MIAIVGMVVVVTAAAVSVGMDVRVMVICARTVTQFLEHRPFDAEGALDLQGGMGDMVAVEQKFLDAAKHLGLLSLECRFDVYVG